MNHLEALSARLRAFSWGDQAEASSLVKALEAAIIDDATGFDEAAVLSRTLEDFTAVTKSGDHTRWLKFLSGLPGAPSEVSDLLQSPELIEKFALEALETLSLVEASLLTMEETRTTGDFLNAAFRAIHTLKGNAGFFGFSAMEALCMEMESVFDSMRRGGADPGSVEMLLEAHDQLRTLVQQKVSVPAKTARPEASRRDIRVDAAKLQSLFDLVGELITAESLVLDHPELKNLSASFGQSATALSKITRDLQVVVTSLRMIPLDGLFAKMKRLVRDLGRKFDKPVELEFSGADTEMDRAIIEEISDPLVHILRNAVDHGLEPPEQRRQAGKNAQGTVRLSARYEGNEVWICVADDGAGLNRERILASAQSRGLVSGAPSDEEVWALIFLPGFSTAAAVSEISGRGVGMDVVKKNLERLRGRIEVKTSAGHGTEFLLKIPLTLAIIDGVTLRSGPTLYSIPIADVVEFQNYREAAVTKTGPDTSVLRLREEVIPFLPLAEVFGTVSRPSANPVLIVVKSQGRKLAVLVDEIVGYKQIVLKPLPEALADLEGLAGCAILGNGEVSLVVDVGALFQRHFA